MSEAVLDASALLALLKEEAGAGKVADAIAASRMTSVNYAEVVSHFIHAGMPAGEVDAMLHPLPMILVEADQALATLAGQLRAVQAGEGLSRAIGRAAWREGARQYAWVEVGVVILIDKRGRKK